MIICSVFVELSEIMTKQSVRSVITVDIRCLHPVLLMALSSSITAKSTSRSHFVSLYLCAVCYIKNYIEVVNIEPF